MAGYREYRLLYNVNATRACELCWLEMLWEWDDQLPYSLSSCLAKYTPSSPMWKFGLSQIIAPLPCYTASRRSIISSTCHCLVKQSGLLIRKARMTSLQWVTCSTCLCTVPGINAFAPAIRTVQQRNGMKRRITSIAFSTQRKLLKTLVAIQGITLSGNSVIGSDRVPPSETELNPQMIQQLCKGYFASLNIVTI